MTDLYLKAPTEVEMNATLLEAGILVEQQIGVTEEGESIFQTVLAPGVSLDVIGPFSKVIGYIDMGPIIKEYPDWHVNIRANLTEEQLELLQPLCIIPPDVPYRTWA